MVYPALPPVRWRVEPNPNYPATQSNSYRIVRTADGQVYNTDLYGNQSLETGGSNPVPVMADVIRRAKQYAGTAQTISLAPNCNLRSFVVNWFSTSQGTVAFWGTTKNGPFLQIKDLAIASEDPLFPARIQTPTLSHRIKDTASNNFDAGPLDNIEFRDIEWANKPGSNYCWETPIDGGELNGLFIHRGCLFTGTNSWGGTWDTKSAIRAGYAAWLFEDCEFHECEEHGVYTGSVQGSYTMRRCFNSSKTGISGARMGKTFVQITSREDVTNAGNGAGPPGYGDVLIEDCVATRTGVNNSSGAITVVGHLGNVRLLRNSFPDTGGGMVTVYSDWGKGMWVFHDGQVKPFRNPPWPISGTAFTTLYLFIDEISGYVSTPWSHPTNPISISGTKLVEIGRFDIVSPRPVFGFWNWSSATTYLGGPFDNGEVRFLVPPLTSPVSAWAGAHGSPIARYGYSGNPNQGPPNGTGSSGILSATGINALTNTNHAYPPWAQPLTGALFPHAPNLSLQARTASVNTTGVHVVHPSAPNIALQARTATVKTTKVLKPSAPLMAMRARTPTVHVGTVLHPSAPNIALVARTAGTILPTIIRPSAPRIAVRARTPTVINGVVLTPSAPDLVLAAATPTVIAATVLHPSAPSIELAALTPTPLAPVVLTPSFPRIRLQARRPRVFVGNLVQPSAPNIELVARTATPLAERILRPSAPNIALAAKTAQPRIGKRLTPSAPNITLRALPTQRMAGPVVITPSAPNLRLDAFPISIQAAIAATHDDDLVVALRHEELLTTALSREQDLAVSVDEKRDLVVSLLERQDLRVELEQEP